MVLDCILSLGRLYLDNLLGCCVEWVLKQRKRTWKFHYFPERSGFDRKVYHPDHYLPKGREMQIRLNQPSK